MRATVEPNQRQGRTSQWNKGIDAITLRRRSALASIVFVHISIESGHLVLLEPPESTTLHWLTIKAESLVLFFFSNLSRMTIHRLHPPGLWKTDIFWTVVTVQSEPFLVPIDEGKFSRWATVSRFNYVGHLLGLVGSSRFTKRNPLVHIIWNNNGCVMVLTARQLAQFE